MLVALAVMAVSGAVPVPNQRQLDFMGLETIQVRVRVRQITTTPQHTPRATYTITSQHITSTDVLALSSSFSLCILASPPFGSRQTHFSTAPTQPTVSCLPFTAIAMIVYTLYHTRMDAGDGCPAKARITFEHHMATWQPKVPTVPWFWRVMLRCNATN